jgi:hypothetical protein
MARTCALWLWKSAGSALASCSRAAKARRDGIQLSEALTGDGALSSCVLDGPRRHRLKEDRLTVRERQDAGMAEDEDPELRAAVSSSPEKIIVRVLSMDRLIKPALCVLCSLVLQVAPASASPSEVSQYLMRTPVSMMTYGVNELSHLLNEEPKTAAVGNIFVKI